MSAMDAPSLASLYLIRNGVIPGADPVDLPAASMRKTFSTQYLAAIALSDRASVLDGALTLLFQSVCRKNCGGVPHQYADPACKVAV